MRKTSRKSLRSMGFRWMRSCDWIFCDGAWARLLLRTQGHYIEKKKPLFEKKTEEKHQASDQTGELRSQLKVPSPSENCAAGPFDGDGIASNEDTTSW